MNSRDKLAAGRLLAKKNSPYFRTAFDALIPHELPRGSFGTIGVSAKGVMIWDAEFVDKLKVEELAAVLEHEVGHLLRNHDARCKAKSANPYIWNLAGDAEINDDLAEARRQLPGRPLTYAEVQGIIDEEDKTLDGAYIMPSTFNCDDGKLAEEYYDAIMKEAKKQAKKQKGQKGKDGAQGKGKGSSDDDGEEDGQDASGKGDEGNDDQHQNPGGGKGQQQGPKKPHPGAGRCGGCAGNPMEGEPKDEGRSEAELRRVRKQVAEAIEQEASKGRGNVPGGWVRWAKDQLAPPKIPWQQKLARAARSAVAYKAGAQDYRYDRPSRRQTSLGYGAGKPILPSMRSPVPSVACAVDTSGSMGADNLTAALREVNGVLKAIGSNIDFVACDAQVHEHKKVRTWKEILPLMKGGGGTCMRPIFDALEASKQRPDVAIVLTDGYIEPNEHLGQKPAGINVIWVCCADNPGWTPPWGECIRVEL